MATSAKLNLSKVLSESRKIIKAQHRNFFALSFLFLTPPSIATLLYSTFQSLFKETNDQPTNTPTKNLILLSLATYIYNVVFSSCAVGSITYTAFHGFSGEAIKLKSAIKSISSSFFPLLGTTLLVQIIVYVIAFILSFGAIFGFLLVSGFRIESLSTPYFVGFVIALMVLMFLVAMYLHVNWSLASVVVVVESAWGFNALKRSKTLIKGKRGLALSLYLIFGFVYGVFVWIHHYPSVGADDHWKCLWLLLALRVLITSGFLTIIQLYNVTAMTVLYAYCKAIDDQKEFSGEYVSLLVDHDEKNVAVVKT